MVGTAARRGRRNRLFTILPIALAIAAATTMVAVSRISQESPDGTVLTLTSALSDYREAPGPLRPELGPPRQLPLAPGRQIAGFSPPEAGVYTYRTAGKDWVEYNGDEYRREFPPTSYATVRRGDGCVWEFWLRPIEEHVDAHRQCSSRGEFLCIAHIQQVSFAGIDMEETHACEPNMLQVGGRAVGPGGVEQTVCRAVGREGEPTKADITITFLGTETLRVGTEDRVAHRVRIETILSGAGMSGTALADAWFDSETGMYLKLVRKGDISVTRSGEKGKYLVDAIYELVDLKPQV